MKLRRAIACVVLVAAPMVASFGSASAGKDCVTYTVTAPFLGTRTGTRCTGNLPPPFTQPFTDDQCTGVPPAKTTVCTTITVYTP
jgi:hypothetical protein